MSSSKSFGARRAGRAMLVVAIVASFVSVVAMPAHAAVPFGIVNFNPDATLNGTATIVTLSDKFDGGDSLAHLTAVATSDTDRVKWFACPTGTGAGIATNAAGAQAALANCNVTIGEDTTPRVPPGGAPFASPIDEAYDVNWDIPGTLDGVARDILALACIGAGEDVEGSDANCKGDSDATNLEDAQTGTLATQTSAGEIGMYCTGDVVSGPSLGATDLCQQSSVTGAVQTQAQLDARYKAFPHGSAVPSGAAAAGGGFVFRATTSDDVTATSWQIKTPADAQTDPTGAATSAAACTLLSTATNFKTWECAVTAALTPAANTESALQIVDTTAGAGNCATDAVICALDVHYIVASDRAATSAISSFAPNDPSPPTAAGCRAGETPDKDESSNLTTTEQDNICITDQFTDPMNGVPFTISAAGPAGSGLVASCGSGPGAGAGGTGGTNDGFLHDHNSDGRNEDCHGVTDATGRGHATASNVTAGSQTATPGDQTLTVCSDAQNGPGVSGAGAAVTPPANHGCADTTVKDTQVIHWVTAPTHVHEVWNGTGTGDTCHTGDTFKQNVVGQRDVIKVCLRDGSENPTSTNAGAFRIQWSIFPVNAGETTATRFVGVPPSSVDSTGVATATLEAFRTGNDVISVTLFNNTTGLQVGAVANIQKSVHAATGSTTGCWGAYIPGISDAQRPAVLALFAKNGRHGYAVFIVFDSKGNRTWRYYKKFCDSHANANATRETDRNRQVGGLFLHAFVAKA